METRYAPSDIAHSAPFAPPPVACGTPAGRGCVIGRARIVLQRGEHANLHPGDILICRSPRDLSVEALSIAAGIIVEVGGPLSSAAIVARELRKPALFGVAHATTLVREGDLIVLDATSGVLRSA